MCVLPGRRDICAKRRQKRVDLGVAEARQITAGGRFVKAEETNDDAEWCFILSYDGCMHCCGVFEASSSLCYDLQDIQVSCRSYEFVYALVSCRMCYQEEETYA